ncbi:MAG: hypothetical protein M0Z39_08830 [Actinomycetota bacterium]|jgi:RNA polymerase-binding transcription factor DksA|nr:hypothetical protein [Actinomycetota bacterium]
MNTDGTSISSSDLEKLSARVLELESQLAQLQTLVRKIDSNTYGQCDACGADLGMDVLASDPETFLCSSHTPGKNTLI